MVNTLMNTYGRLPVNFERGEGVWLYDGTGKRYLDGIAGVGVCGLGHAHPGVTRALCEQAGNLLHTSNLYGIPLQECLGDRLTTLAGMERVFFCNSGAEANEAAIKLARLYGNGKGLELPAIVVVEGSFHGRTLATLSATGNRKVQAGFEPLVQGFVRVAYNDLNALEALAGHTTNVAAVLLEPVQGEGGVIIPDEGYLTGVRELCDRHGWLMMLDEVQTGMGRTGDWFACRHEQVTPDVMTLAKGLGNGVPIGACLAKGAAAELMQPGSHGSTFGGNPLACRAALTVIDALEKGDIPAAAGQAGDRLAGRLSESLQDIEGVREIRNKGLMIAVELEQPCGELVQRALERGVLLNVTAGNVVRLLPPLILNSEEADELAAQVTSLVVEFCRQ